MKYSILSNVLLAGLLASSCSTQPEIAQWRGPERTGVFPETGLLDEWPEDGPELLWVYEGLGLGYASPAVTTEQVFIKAEEEGDEFLCALDRDGKLLWKAQNGKAFLGEGFSASYPGARSTPTVYRDRVYSTSGMGDVACFDTQSGDKIWSLNIVEDLGGEGGFFGYSESPALDKKHVYIFPGGQEHNFCALDRHSGKISWSSKVLLDTFAYGSPILVNLPQKEVVISTSRHNIFVLDQRNGELLSSSPIKGFQYDGEHCNSVIYQQGHLYFVSNEHPGQGALKLKLSDDGSFLEEVWRNPEVLNNFGGFLVLDGSILTTIKGNKLVALDPQTGTITDTLKASIGSLVAADEKLYNYGYNGKIHMAKQGNDGLILLAETKVKEGSGQHFSHPVIQDGIMYIRRGSSLMAYRIGKAEGNTLK